MAADVQDFKRTSRKVVKLPGGLEVEIRKLTGLDFADFGEFPVPSRADGGGEPSAVEEMKKARALGEHMIARAVVAPPFSDKPEDLNNPSVVHVNDLSMDDFNALAFEIIRFSGLGKEGQAEAESFRADQK